MPLAEQIPPDGIFALLPRESWSAVLTVSMRGSHFSREFFVVAVVPVHRFDRAARKAAKVFLHVVRHRLGNLAHDRPGITQLTVDDLCCHRVVAEAQSETVGSPSRADTRTVISVEVLGIGLIGATDRLAGRAADLSATLPGNDSGGDPVRAFRVFFQPFLHCGSIDGTAEREEELRLFEVGGFHFFVTPIYPSWLAGWFLIFIVEIIPTMMLLYDDTRRLSTAF